MLELAARVAQGDTAALARACRLVDERVEGYRALLHELFPLSGRARTIGITGAPGVGKSTLTDALVTALRAQGQRVGVIAIDPSSPFSGGALLGDRIRMQRHSLDEEVFVRSLGSRGAHGGLSRSAADTLRLLSAWGAATVLLETVGVGQAEFDFLGVVESAVLVVMPGAGDDVPQSLKEMGYDVRMLNDGDLTADGLRGLDAVVIGVRAFNTRRDLAAHLPALFAYVNDGGTVVTQYNVATGLLTTTLARTIRATSMPSICAMSAASKYRRSTPIAKPGADSRSASFADPRAAMASPRAHAIVRTIGASSAAYAANGWPLR